MPTVEIIGEGSVQVTLTVLEYLQELGVPPYTTAQLILANTRADELAASYARHQNEKPDPSDEP